MYSKEKKQPKICYNLLFFALLLVNTNSILYYEVNKTPSAYKWQPGGDWQRGRVDLEMLQFAYKKEEEEFSKSHMKLQEQTEISRRLRDDKHFQMMKLRER